MKNSCKKKFLKDVNKLPDHIKQGILDIVFKQIPEIESIQDFRNLNKLTGFKNFYRIRYSDYRIGIAVQ